MKSKCWGHIEMRNVPPFLTACPLALAKAIALARPAPRTSARSTTVTLLWDIGPLLLPRIVRQRQQGWLRRWIQVRTAIQARAGVPFNPFRSTLTLGGCQLDDALGVCSAVLGSEALLERPLELAALRQLLDDVSAANELAAHEDLGDRRPAGERRELLADARVGEDVDRRDRRACPAQRLERALGVPAHRELGRALHEQRHVLGLDDLLDLVRQFAHSAPLVLILSS